jgi:WD40 repeat protein
MPKDFEFFHGFHAARIGDFAWIGTSTVYGVAFSPDGKRLAAGGAGGALRVWEAKRGESSNGD